MARGGLCRLQQLNAEFVLSTVLLIDGYNVIGPVAPPRDFMVSREARKGSSGQVGRPDSWLQVERKRFLDHLAEHLSDLIRERTYVVFDAKNAPRGRAAEAVYQSIQVRYAVEYPEADDLLEELIQNHPTPKHLTVVSSDHRVQVAARRRKAAYFDSDPWYDDVLEGKVRLGWYPRKKLKRTKTASQPSLGLDQEPTSGPELSGPEMPEVPELEMTDDELREWIDRLDS